MRTVPELQFESSYIEEGVFYVLVSPMEADDDRRYTVEAEPGSREILEVFACRSTNDGIFELEYDPSLEDAAAFQAIVDGCPVDADDGSVAQLAPGSRLA